MENKEVLGLKLKFEVRKLKRKHFAFCATVERTSEENFWHRGVLRRHCKRANCFGGVAFFGKRPVGYIACQFHPRTGQLQILNLVVQPYFRRKGAAKKLIKWAKRKVSWASVHVYTRESNLAAQLLFRSMEFRADRIVRDYFLDYDKDHLEDKQTVFKEDGYGFVTTKERIQNETQLAIFSNGSNIPVALLWRGGRSVNHHGNR